MKAVPQANRRIQWTKGNQISIGRRPLTLSLLLELNTIFALQGLDMRLSDGKSVPSPILIISKLFVD
jgi:hypothetical protein